MRSSIKHRMVTYLAWITVLSLGQPAICTSANAAPSAQTRPSRLSDWLLTHPPGQDDYPLGLVWNVPGEIPPQTKQRADLLLALSQAEDGGEPARLIHDWIAAMPVTGRVPVAIADAAWLQANPGQDPVMREGQTITLPKRPRTVMLMLSSGKRCQLQFVSGWMARDYLSECDAAALGSTDWAWIIQPDGKYARYGIAAWNVQSQNSPAPGAWIWVPLRHDRWAVRLSAPIAQSLANQGVAPEPEPVTPATAKAPAPNVDNPDYYRGRAVTANDWGEAGLLQTPTARMRNEGFLSLTVSRVYPYDRINVFLQPLSWLEFGFRYTSIGNRLYGPTFAGSQTYKDKSADVKLSLLEESAYKPEIALGMRDFIGTGLFSSEYLVANKRMGAFDASLGLGWGYLGARQNLNNPLSIFGQSFNTRPATNTVNSGDFSYHAYFRGRPAPFGGVQYHTPWDPLVLKLEFDGNNYQHEPLADNMPQNSPWNVGAVYRLGPAVEFTVGYERGNTLMVGLTFQADLSELSTPKLDDPPSPPAYIAPPLESGIDKSTARDITAATNWQVNSITQDGNTLRVSLDNADQVYWSERVQRAIAILNRDASRAVTNFEFDYREHDMKLVEQQVDRNAWVTQQTQLQPPSAIKNPVTTGPVSAKPAEETKSTLLYQGEPDSFQFQPGLSLNYNLGGPNNFILYEIAAKGEGVWKFSDSSWMQGNIQYNLFDNYSNYTYTAASSLPRVRTYIREYLTTSRLTMPNLQLSHVGKLGENQYYSFYGGYLEMMFGGIGAEWLYRPASSSLALGIDINRVRQRDFGQNFSYASYQVTTGNLTLYWDTGWNDVRATLSAGRYLAGDAGGTMQLERIFQNGVSMGGFVTKTNVSAQQFGEGSFNKGIFITIPFDAMMTRSSGSTATFLWQPLIRDGGAMLDRQLRLYDMTRLLDARAAQYAPVLPDITAP